MKGALAVPGPNQRKKGPPAGCRRAESSISRLQDGVLHGARVEAGRGGADHPDVAVEGDGGNSRVAFRERRQEGLGRPYVQGVQLLEVKVVGLARALRQVDEPHLRAERRQGGAGAGARAPGGLRIAHPEAARVHVAVEERLTVRGRAVGAAVRQVETVVEDRRARAPEGQAERHDVDGRLGVAGVHGDVADAIAAGAGRLPEDVEQAVEDRRPRTVVGIGSHDRALARPVAGEVHVTVAQQAAGSCRVEDVKKVVERHGRQLVLRRGARGDRDQELARPARAARRRLIDDSVVGITNVENVDLIVERRHTRCGVGESLGEDGGIGSLDEERQEQQGHGREQTESLQLHGFSFLRTEAQLAARSGSASCPWGVSPNPGAEVMTV